MGSFLNALKDVFSNTNQKEKNAGIDLFLSTCSKVLKKHVPCKKSRKRLQKRSKLRSKFLKTRYDTDKFNYNKQRKLVSVPCMKRKNKVLCKSTSQATKKSGKP